MRKDQSAASQQDFSLMHGCSCVYSESLGHVQDLIQEVKWLQTTEMGRLLSPRDGFRRATLQAQIPPDGQLK